MTLCGEGIHYYSNPGEYTIRQIVVTDSSCSDTNNVQISLPPLPVADFDYHVEHCDSNVQFINLSRRASRFLWRLGDNSYSSDKAPYHAYSISGFIPVTLVAFSGENCRSTFNKDIFFSSYKKAYFSSTLDSCSGLVNFIDVTNDASSYLWNFGDGDSSTVHYPIHKFKKDGEHPVSLAINVESLCSDVANQRVKYESPLGEKLFVPNSFTPNGDGHNDFFEINNFRPCELYKLTIFNRWGQKVFETEDASNMHWDGSFAGEKLADDVYVYILENGDINRKGIISIMR